ncbi:4Fe-4S binding protein [Ornithinimicrobium sp. INDO-MA30-4]|uniref:4Fe-4S binding protein n=1 Tax=Ornithinimicrobium sp. INDO-MA30-4 TaxID=2908651 RepID=UPI001F460C4C|nr:4Fe-4S binding protein [Ornithinimicrobium sp. INDO-MA30-4]UJH69484.1 4Fe-4S binding protein [Ornithinimicrobium sp. INDO-MA30-4]
MKGLIKGLKTTAKTLVSPTHTQQYPHVEPELPDRSRGVIALLADNCTSCMLCARECPDWCIYIDSHKETEEPTVEGGRAKSHNVLDRFDIDFSLCMYCGICIEVCPFDALFGLPTLPMPKATSATCCTAKTASAAGWPRCQMTPELKPKAAKTTWQRRPRDRR